MTQIKVEDMSMPAESVEALKKIEKPTDKPFRVHRAPHRAVMKAVLEHPGATLKELSKMTGYSISTISTLRNKPAALEYMQSLIDERLPEITRKWFGK